MTKQELLSKNEKLRQAALAYYSGNNPIMSDREYDALYDEVRDGAIELGIVLEGSPINNVGFEVVSNLQKDRHEVKALSLDKTKDREALKAWLGTNVGCLSWKEDGLTLVVTYDNGKLTKAVTRGNGEIGEIVTHNAKYIKGLPMQITYDKHLVVRGECLMTYSNFEKINNALDSSLKYKNPRNLTSGTIRSLDSSVVAQRGLSFKAFELVSLDTGMPGGSFCDSLAWLSTIGFDVVEYKKVTAETLLDAISEYERKLSTYDYPSDGLVLQIDDMVYGRSLGTTGKFPRSGKAFKWKDETAVTTLRQIQWQASRTGLINPVAIFDPVELEGTTVQRATANNISFMKKMHLSVGSKIIVYKANMIIPTIDGNAYPVGEVVIPTVCPSCGRPTKIMNTGNAEVLYCDNVDCPAKDLKHFTHFVSRDAMNIDGLSESTLEKLMNAGLVNNYYDLYKLSGQINAVAQLDGYGPKAATNLIKGIEKSRQVALPNFIYAFGIENIGKQVSKDISKLCGYDVQVFVQNLNAGFDWTQIDGVGDVIQNSLMSWWSEKRNRDLFIALASIMQFKQPAMPTSTVQTGISGKTFCVTGSVHIFKNRNELGAYIEQKGGKLVSSVTSNTDYLVTNDTTSGSAKNKKAQELGKPILTEEQLLQLGGD